MSSRRCASYRSRHRQPGRRILVGLDDGQVVYTHAEAAYGLMALPSRAVA